MLIDERTMLFIANTRVGIWKQLNILPDWKTKSSLASPSTLQKLSGSAHETGNGTNAPTHFEFQLVRPSVCQNY